MGNSLFDLHRGTLYRAVDAVRQRAFWTPYPEAPSRAVYGETAREDGLAAFTELLGADFVLPGLHPGAWVEGEQSAYGIELGIRYPEVSPEAAVTAAAAALPSWRDAGPQTRAGVCLEILHRLNRRSFELAHAGMHTTGQPFVMAFQATGPHAQDRGLEAVAHAYAAMTSQPSRVAWDKPTARSAIVVDKDFYVVPRGVALVLACSTFPAWNSYPGLFASLVTGNPVIVKPHPRAVLPLALTVRVGREVLTEQGFSPDLLSLVVDGPGQRHASTLATLPEVRVIDYTGSRPFGEWLEENARQARVYAEKSGVNCIIIDSTDDVDGMCRNIAYSLALYSGQMCTAPQAIFVPRGGVETERGRMSREEVGNGIVRAVDELVRDPARGENVLGAIGNPDVVSRIHESARAADVLRSSDVLPHSQFPNAQLRTPLVLAADVTDLELYGAERFGPISFVVATEDSRQSLDTVRELGLTMGALTTSLYTTSEDVVAKGRDLALAAGTTLSVNLTGELFVNQSAAFSDFHGTGNNPAANTTLVDQAFVSDRFTVVEVRRPRAGNG
jgi:phenylacetic acid degradation protein paaN